MIPYAESYIALFGLLAFMALKLKAEGQEGERSEPFSVLKHGSEATMHKDSWLHDRPFSKVDHSSLYWPLWPLNLRLKDKRASEASPPVFLSM